MSDVDLRSCIFWTSPIVTFCKLQKKSYWHIFKVMTKINIPLCLSFVEGSKWFARCQMLVFEAISFEPAQPWPSTTFKIKVMDKIRRRRTAWATPSCNRNTVQSTIWISRAARDRHQRSVNVMKALFTPCVFHCIQMDITCVLLVIEGCRWAC